MTIQNQEGHSGVTRVSFSYSDVPPLTISDSNLLACLAPRVLEPARPVADLVEKALDHPFGSPTLEALASPGARVLILVDDITRQTPASEVLPSVLRRLGGSGVNSESIRILIAAGTHARMNQQEIEQKLGPDVPKQYAVSIHHWRDEHNLGELGTTRDGTPIRVHRLLGESDLVIGIGQIVPHRVMGFTGGATIVQPGVSGAAVTGYTHWMSALYAGAEILGIAENPVRKEVEEIARRAGLRFIVNVVMDGRARVLHVVAGDPVAAHREGARHSRGVYGVAQPALADMVIAESYPADYDLWQAAKGVYAAELAVRPGGVVVLVTPCPHGVSQEHPEVERLGYHGYAEVKAMVERREITDLVAAAHLVHVGRVIRDRAQGIMVSPGIAPETQRQLGFRWAASPQEALELAFGVTGRESQVVVLKQGGHVLPLVAKSE
ncbi:MAG TPA: nickel-dependent lactate racemase [Terriglobia bacterium]|nr:nickel-dependent lactate racemase [Terriglobia bacterium]